VSAEVLPASFQTSRLEAERLEPHHLPDLIEFHRDAEVMAELGGVRDEQKTREYLIRNLAHWEKHGFGVWVLREPSRSVFIGRAILRYLMIEGTLEVEVGFALYPRFWGRGFATEVANRCSELAWCGLPIGSLVGVTTENNFASQRVLQKVGLHYQREILIEGTRCALYRGSRPS
jgi:RimJ/RimL family protein N-acetyltransferase